MTEEDLRLSFVEAFLIPYTKGKVPLNRMKLLLDLAGLYSKLPTEKAEAMLSLAKKNVSDLNGMLVMYKSFGVSVEDLAYAKNTIELLQFLEEAERKRG